jgi:rhodanese-related sulfurtransferase
MAMTTTAPPAGALGIAEILEAARARLHRVTPEQAYAEAGDGAVLVDIRPAAQRAAEGEIPGAIIIERNVLEWRLDPAGFHRLPDVTGFDQPLVVVCSEGYASSLAAHSLQGLGFRRVSDLAGGYQAWMAWQRDQWAGPRAVGPAA